MVGHRGIIAFALAVLTISLAAPAPNPPVFPLRIDPPPKEWKADEINEGLPYRWEKGVVHILAWEVIEDDRPWKFAQVLVLKKFDRPILREKGEYKWVWLLAHLYPGDDHTPWRGPMRIPPPFPKGAEIHLTDAQVFGHEFYSVPPTDKQIEAFLNETQWTVYLNPRNRTPTTRVTAGGINREKWKMLLGRDVPTDLFPELKRTGNQ